MALSTSSVGAAPSAASWLCAENRKNWLNLFYQLHTTLRIPKRLTDTEWRAADAGSLAHLLPEHLEDCGELILQRKFENTGSHIGTMYKDLGITMSMAREAGCAMFTTAAARELFQAGISIFPQGDNWSIVKFLERIAGTEVKG